jgi:hypothetical protein
VVLSDCHVGFTGPGINLTGKRIKRLNADPSTPLRAGWLRFDDGEVLGATNPDWNKTKSPSWWCDHEKDRPNP